MTQLENNNVYFTQCNQQIHINIAKLDTLVANSYVIKVYNMC